MSLFQRSLRSLRWTTAASLLKLPIGLLQSILLARLLPVEAFGAYAGVSAVILLSGVLFEFGLSGAYFHRAPETEDESQATTLFFTLRLLLYSVWAALLALGGWFFLDGSRLVLFQVFLLLTYLGKLTDAPRLLLMRRVKHRRLAALDLASALASAIGSVSAAVIIRDVWALLVPPLISFLCLWIGLFLVYPVWKPRLGWNWQGIRYFLRFGLRTHAANLMGQSLDYVDTLWTAVFLGDTALGYYSRAYRFATYPRTLLAEQSGALSAGIYAELKADRPGLSQAFTWINLLLIRGGFLLGAWLALLAPEFVVILLGERWLPMVEVFRWMLVFALLDPMKSAMTSLLVVTGRPGKASLMRLVQLLVLITCLFIFGRLHGIVGVAVAMDLMALAGLGLGMIFARQVVDFSIPKLLAFPLLALIAGLGLSQIISPVVEPIDIIWLVMAIKTLVLCVTYLTVLVVFERNTFGEIIHRLTHQSD